ncbi:unnamed protein product [Peniophora sp. CBMAI 1063]|nr:unnamed protein product [Peniophora sp. CBMAI 1063]
MILIFVVNILLLLCLSRRTRAQGTANFSISFASPNAKEVGFSAQGSSVQSNELDASIELPLPAGTQSVYVQGLAQPDGAQAAACIDCIFVDEKLVGMFQAFDTSTIDGSTQLRTLAGPYFLDPDVTHNLTIINTDTDPNKTLTLDSLFLTIQTSSTTTTTTTATSSGTATASAPTQPSSMSSPSPSASQSAVPSATASSSAAATGDTSQQRILAIVLSTVLGSIALFALLFSIFCLRRRRRKRPPAGRISGDASSSAPVLGPASSDTSNVTIISAAEAGIVSAVRPLPQMPQMREAETPAPPSANQRVKPLPPVPSPPRSQQTPIPSTPRTPQTPASSSSLYSSSSPRLSTRPPSGQPSSYRSSGSPRRTGSTNLRRLSSNRALRQYPPMPMPMPPNTNVSHLSQLPKEWQFYADPVLPREAGSPRHLHSPSVYSLGFAERDRIEHERVNSGIGGREEGDVGGGFGFRLSRGTIVYPMTPSASGEGLPDEWEP